MPNIQNTIVFVLHKHTKSVMEIWFKVITNSIVLSYIPIKRVYSLHNVNLTSRWTIETNSKLVENMAYYQKLMSMKTVYPMDS